MKLRAGIAAAACCLVFAGPAGAAPAGAGTWTGSGTVSLPLLSPVPLPGGDPFFVLTGHVVMADGTSGTCQAYWWEDPSGLLAGVAFGLTANLSCTGDVAFLTGACVVTRVVTVSLVCVATPGQKVVAELAIVPSDVPMTRFAFAGPIAYVAV